MSLNLLSSLRPHLIWLFSTFYIVDHFFLKTHPSFGFCVTVFLFVVFSFTLFLPCRLPSSLQKQIKWLTKETPHQVPAFLGASSPSPHAAPLLAPCPVHLALAQDYTWEFNRLPIRRKVNVFLSSPSWIYPWLKDTSDYDPITAPTACAVFALRDTEIAPCLKVPPQTAHHWTIHRSWMAANSFPKIVFGIKQIKQIDVSRKSLLKYTVYLRKGVRLHGHL